MACLHDLPVVAIKWRPFGPANVDPSEPALQFLIGGNAKERLDSQSLCLIAFLSKLLDEFLDLVCVSRLRLNF